MKLDYTHIFGGVNIGVNVDIKRSDRRIHSTCVTGLKPESRSASVEWFENNETKGKEIDIDIIHGLNQNVISTQSQAKTRYSVQPNYKERTSAAQNDKVKSRKVFCGVTRAETQCPSKDTILVHEPKTKVDLTKYLENQNKKIFIVLDMNYIFFLVKRFPHLDSIFLF